MYEIVITKKEMIEKRGGQEWTIVAEDFWGVKDMKDEAYYRQGDIDKAYQSGKIPKKQVYGHTPKIDITEEVETEIYRQTVEKLDLVQVIQAINNM